MYTDSEYQSLLGKLTLLDEDAAFVLEGGSVIDGIADSPLTNAAVVIDGDIITWVGSAKSLSLSPDRDYVMVDASGKTIMPGLIDAHVHYLGDLNADPYQSHATLSARVRVFRAARDLVRTLNGGFTTVRDLGHGDPGNIQAIKDAINEGTIIGPRILSSRWAISQTGGHGNLRIWPYDLVERCRPRSTFADGPYGCRAAARRNFGEGADLIKIYTTEGPNDVPNFTLEEITAICEEAHTRAAKVSAHAKAYDGIRNAVLGGVDVIEHGMMELDLGLLDLMAERQVILVPTYANYYFLAYEGEPWGVTPARAARARRSLEQVPGCLQEARARGVKVALGTDTGHGGGPGVARNAKQLELLVLAGLTPMEAIKAGSSVAAEALGLEEYIGTIERGKLAEMIVMGADPVADINRLQDRSLVEGIFKSRRSLALGERTMITL